MESSTTETINPRFFPNLNPFDPFVTSEPRNNSNPGDYERQLCAPYPLCDPQGCGKESAISCVECNSTGVALALLGMCLLSITIVIFNILVIVIITRTASLQRRHGYIKVSLAVSDLLIGLLILPAAIYNLAISLYLHPESDEDFANRFIQTNQVASVFFGTVLIVSLTASIYNLLLLSLDRFLAVARPLQNRSGKYFSRRRLSICIGIVWFIGILVSSLPAMMTQKFTYILSPTTFFYVMSTVPDHVHDNGGAGPIALFALVVMGIPYVFTVVFNLVTLSVTLKKLATRERLGSVSGTMTKSKRQRKSEEAKRLKMILDTCPEMNESSSSKSGWLKAWNKNNHNDKQKPGRISKERIDSVNASFHKHKKPVNLNYRVTRMILSMVIGFTVCICPYMIVNSLMVNGDLNCSNMGVIYNVVTYLVLLNSIMNFCIYNLWHREFRRNQLRKSSNGFGTSGSKQISAQWPIAGGNARKPSYQLSSGVSSFQASN